MPDRIDPALRECYDCCRKLQRRRDPTYYWATRRLPPDVRPAVHALYAFVREVDDVVDVPGTDTAAATRRSEVGLWEERLRRARAGGAPGHPVVAALADAGRRHDLPLDELDLYFDSMRVDCAPVRVQTWSELELYMRGSAGSVGSILGALLGASNGGREPFERLALAFQLTNFVRDVARTGSSTASTCPPRTSSASGSRWTTSPAASPPPAFAACSSSRSNAPGSCSGRAPPPRRSSHRAWGGAYGWRAPSTRACSTAPSASASTSCDTAPTLPPWELAGAVASGLRTGA